MRPVCLGHGRRRRACKINCRLRASRECRWASSFSQRIHRGAADRGIFARPELTSQGSCALLRMITAIIQSSVDLWDAAEVGVSSKRMVGAAIVERQ
jgi:hypothetical protein